MLQRRSPVVVACLLLSFLLSLAPVGCGPSSPTVPDTAEGTVRTLYESLGEGKPEVLWAMLPASYQKELQDDVVRAFAAKMDPEIYGKGVAVLNKVTALLREKKDFIVPQIVLNPMFQMAQVDGDKFAQNWDKVIGLLDTVLSSELGDLGKLKTIDPGSFLRVTGGKLMRQVSELSSISAQDPYKKNFQDVVKGAKIEVVKAEGDAATLKISGPSGTTTTEMVRVEGKWLPKEMVDGWKEAMAKAKAQIAGIDPKAMEAEKPKILGTLTGIETALDQLSKAKTKEEFFQVAGGLMSNLPLPMGLPGMGPGGGAGGISPEPEEEPSEKAAEEPEEPAEK